MRALRFHSRLCVLHTMGHSTTMPTRAQSLQQRAPMACYIISISAAATIGFCVALPADALAQAHSRDATSSSDRGDRDYDDALDDHDDDLDEEMLSIEALIELETAFLTSRWAPITTDERATQFDNYDGWGIRGHLEGASTSAQDPFSIDLSSAARPQPIPEPVSLSFDPSAIVNLPLDLDHVYYPALLEFLEFYHTEGRNRAMRWRARSGRYQDMIYEIADELGAPRELIWVAAIESSFTPDVRSRAGALGMWQFMTRTAHGRGFRIDRYVDERLDPVISTRFGLEYLMSRYERFGTWPLALAAYNAGSGHVRGELRSNNINDFWVMDRYSCLYPGARRYAVRVFALAIIDLNPEVFGFDAVVYDEPWTYDVVDVPGGVRLALLGDAVGLSLSEMRALNPSLRNNQTPPGETFPLRIPYGSTSSFVESYDRLARRYGSSHELVRLRFGESLGQLAVQNGIPERVLRAINGLERFDRSPYGAELIVPTEGRRSQDDPRRDPGVILLPETRFSYPDRRQIFYAVHTGDTAVEIATHFGVSVHDLAAWNDIDPRAALWDDMVLQLFIDPDRSLDDSLVWRADEVLAFALGSPEHVAHLDAQVAEARTTRARQRTHTVRRGETVIGIARRYGVRPSDLMRWNSLGDDAMIIVGQRLVVSR